MCSPLSPQQPVPTGAWPRYSMSAYGRDGHLRGRAQLDHYPSEQEQRDFRAQHPETRLEWTTFTIEVALV